MIEAKTIIEGVWFFWPIGLLVTCGGAGAVVGYVGGNFVWWWRPLPNPVGWERTLKLAAFGAVAGITIGVVGLLGVIR